MKIFISPAKSFNEELYLPGIKPKLSKKTKIILQKLQSLQENELASLMGTSKTITKTNYDRFQNFDKLVSIPAIYAYSGQQYKMLDSQTLSDKEINHLQKNLRIISAFYGVLKPLDPIKPYRLEMKTILKIENYKNLYGFWGKDIALDLLKDEDVIVNLASNEYSKGIDKYLLPNQTYINCVFKVKDCDKLRALSTYSKKGRGLMVRYIAQNFIDDYDKLKDFDYGGFKFSEELSKTSGKIKEFIFVLEVNINKKNKKA